MKKLLLKFSFWVTISIMSLQVYAQQVVTSSGSPIGITSNTNMLIAMDGTSGFSLSITNTNTTGAISGIFQVGFPSDFYVQFPTIGLDPSIQISSPGLANNYNTYTITISKLASNNAGNNTVNIDYTIESCFPTTEFSTATNLSTSENLVFTSTDSKIIINNQTFNQPITITEGQSVLLGNANGAGVLASDNLQALQYDGSTFTRTFRIVSNGTKDFTGVINFSDQLGSSLQLNQQGSYSLQVIFPGSTIPVTLPCSLSVTGMITATIDFSTSSLPIGSEIQVIENLLVVGCLNTDPTDVAKATSQAQITWKESTNGLCVQSSQVVTTTVTRPASLVTSIQTNDDPSFSADICYRLDPASAPIPTPESQGVYTNNKVFSNSVGSGINLNNVRVHLYFDWVDIGLATKRPLEGVILQRRNSTVGTTRDLLIDFNTLGLDKVSDINGLTTIVQNYSSYCNSNNSLVSTNIGDYNNPATPNIIQLFTNGSDCSSSNFQMIQLILDRYPVAPGVYQNLDYQEGDVYTITWEEVQCCRTDESISTRWGQMNVYMEYPVCNNWVPMNNDTYPGGYFNILEMSQDFLANTTKLYAGPTPTGGPGQLGEVHLETTIYSTYLMNNYPLLDGSLHTFLDIDVLLTDGLSMDIETNIPRTSPEYKGYITYSNGGVNTQWLPTFINNPVASRTLTNLDDVNITSPIPVTEYYTMHFDMYDFAVNTLNIQPGDPNFNVQYVLGILATNTQIFFNLRAVDCPPGDISYISVRSYLVNKPSCNTCRNLIANNVFEAVIHCPGCITPGPAISSATSLRDTQSLGLMDNNNDGVPDLPQDPTQDHRDRSSLRLGDFLNTSVQSVLSDGNSGNGFTYYELRTARPDYIQNDAYLRTTFNWTKGAVEIQSVVCTLNRSGTNYSKTLLDLSTNTLPGAGYILMQNGANLVDYTMGTADANGFKTAQSSKFYFHVNLLNDFGITSLTGFDFGSDQVSFTIIYQVVGEITAANNIVEVDYLLYTSPSSSTYAGAANTVDIGDIWGRTINNLSQLPTPSSEAYFWCTAGVSIFGYVPYEAYFSNFLQDPYLQTYDGSVANSCQKIMHIKSEVWPVNNSGEVNYNAFENEYRTVANPTQYLVQIPKGYTIDKIMLRNSTNVDYYGSRIDYINEYISIPTPALDNTNSIIITVPPYVVASNPGLPGSTGLILGDVNGNGSNPAITQFEQMDDLLYLELMITLHADCNNPAVLDNICWQDKTLSAAPFPNSTIVNSPIVTITSIPSGGDNSTPDYFRADPAALQTITTNGQRYPRGEGNFYFIKPKTDISVTSTQSTVVNVGASTFDIGVALTNNPAVDASGNVLPNPYNPPLDANGNLLPPPYSAANTLPAINADYTYFSLNVASLPLGLIIDYIYESQTVLPLASQVKIIPKSPLPLPLGSGTDYLFDLGSTAANQQRNFRIVGHYDCSFSSNCDPFDPALLNCMNGTNGPNVKLNYGWNCQPLATEQPINGASSCADNGVLPFTFVNEPVQAKVVVPAKQVVQFCQTNTFQIELDSKQAGSIDNYIVTFTLPDNAYYSLGTSTFGTSPSSGTTIQDPAVSNTLMGTSNVLKFDLSSLNLNSNIYNNSSYFLQFSYTVNCTSGSEASGMNLTNLTTNVDAVSYCGTHNMSVPYVTTLTNSSASYDNLLISSMIPSPAGDISQGDFSSSITVQNTSSVSTTGADVLQITLPAGVTLDASNTTSGYSILDPTNPNSIVWPISTISGGNSVNYVVSYTIAPFSTCQENLVIQAKIVGQPIPCNNTSGVCNAPLTLSSNQCTTTVTSSNGILPVNITTSTGAASLLCSSEGSSSTVTFVGSVPGGTGNYTYTWTNPNGTIIGQSSTLTVSTAGIYTLSVSDGNGCSGSNSAEAKNQINTICPGDICPGDNPSLQLDMGGVVGTYQVDWYNQSNPGFAIAPGITDAGNYYGLVIIPACTLQTSVCPIAFKRYPQPYQISPTGPTGLCKNQSVTLTVNNPGINDLSYTNVEWSTGQTGLNPLVVTMDQNFYNYTSQDGSEGSYVMVAKDAVTGCQTLSNPAYVYSPFTKIDRQCTSTGKVLLLASSNIASGSYTWSTLVNGVKQVITDPTMLVDPSGMNAQLLVSQPGYYFADNDLSQQCGSGWGIYENMATSGNPNANKLGTDGLFQSFQSSNNCSQVQNFLTDYPCLDQTSYPTTDKTTTIGKYMINYGNLGGDSWNPTSGQWSFVPYSIQPNPVPYPNNFMVIDGVTSTADKRIWYMTGVPITHNLYYLFQASLLNIDASSQNPAKEIPEVYLRITYHDASGNGIGYEEPIQIFYQNNNPLWLEISQFTLAGYGLEVNGLPITAVTADIEIIMRGGGSVGRDIALDDVRLIPIGICDDPNAIISADTRGCGVDLVSVDNTQKYTCNGVPITFTTYQIGTNPNLTFTWKDASNGQVLGNGLSLTVSPSMTTNYTLTLVDVVHQCTSTIEMTAYVVSPSLHIASTPANANICLTSPLSFSVDQFVGIGGVSYQWLVNNTAVSSITASTYSSATLKDQDQVMCQLVSGCLDQNNAPLKVNSNIIKVIGSQLGSKPAGSNQTVCKGSGLQIGAVLVNGATYSWSPTTYLDDATKAQPTVTPTGTETSLTYTLTGTDANGCTTTDQVTVTVNPLPNAPTGSGGTICGSGSLIVNVLNPQTGYVYNWYDAATGGNLLGTGIQYSTSVISTTTVYYLTAKNSNGCESTTTPVAVTVNPTPSTSQITGSSAVCANQAGVGYSVLPTSGSTYSWTVPSGAGIASGMGTNSITVNFGTTSGNVSVIETNATHCAGTSVSKSVTVNPNATIALTSAVGTNAQSECINTALATISYSIGGGGTGATVVGLPSGVTGSYNTGVFTISGTPTVSGTFHYTITTTGTCAQTTATGTIAVNSNSVITLTSAVGTNAQSICINTALTPIKYSIGGGATGATATGLPLGVTGAFSSGVFRISGTPSVSGIFNYTITTTGSVCPETANGSIIVNTVSPCLTTAIDWIDEVIEITEIIPNPSDDNFNLKVSSKDYKEIEITIMDTNGKMVETAKGTTNAAIVFGSEFAAGVYVVKVISGENAGTYKIVKIK